jgi:hypothetical protein
MSFGTKSQKSSQTSLDYGSEIWGQQAPYLAQLYQGASNQLGSQGQDPVNYMLRQRRKMKGEAPSFEQGAQGFGLGMQAGQGLLGYGGQGYNPFASQAIQGAGQALGRQFSEQFLPQLKGQAIQAGGLGGSRQQIGAALGAERFADQLTDYATQVGLQGYEGQQQRQLQALQSAGQLGAGLYGTGAGVGGQLAATRMGLSPQIAEMMRSTPWYGLAQYGGLLGSPTQIDLGGKTTGSGGGSGFNVGIPLPGGG